MGHKLLRPEADFLRDEIYELRVRLGGVHHRILYFYPRPDGGGGLLRSRERAGGPSKEIDQAVERKKRFKANPANHNYEEA